MTLYYPDGTHEVVYGKDDEELKDFFLKVVEKKCGHEAVELFQIITEVEPVSGDDYEAISDGYLQMLNSVVDELDAVVKQIRDAKRINKDNLLNSLIRIKKSIVLNI